MLVCLLLVMSNLGMCVCAGAEDTRDVGVAIMLGLSVLVHLLQRCLV